MNVRLQAKWLRVQIMLLSLILVSTGFCLPDSLNYHFHTSFSFKSMVNINNSAFCTSIVKVCSSILERCFQCWGFCFAEYFNLLYLFSRFWKVSAFISFFHYYFGCPMVTAGALSTGQPYFLDEHFIQGSTWRSSKASWSWVTRPGWASNGV